MNRGKPKRTTCDRCGATVRYRYGAAREFCDDCHEVIRDRKVRR